MNEIVELDLKKFVSDIWSGFIDVVKTCSKKVRSWYVRITTAKYKPILHRRTASNKKRKNKYKKVSMIFERGCSNVSCR